MPEPTPRANSVKSVKRRILMVHNQYRERGGESSVFENEMRGLRERGHDVVVYQQSNESVAGLGPLHKLRVVVEAYGSSATRRDLGELLAKARPDVAIVQNVFPLISPSVYTTLHAHAVPVIQAVYNYRLICPAAELYSQGEICERCVRGSMLNAVTRKCYRDSRVASAWYASIIALHRRLGTFERCIDAFMVPDHFLGRKLAEGGLPAAKMWRNANPFFLPAAPSNIGHAGYVLYVGRLTRPKGVLTAIDAMRLVSCRARLLVVGAGELESEIEQELERDDLRARVSFVGPKWGDELASLIAGAVALLVPSEWYDNLPQVLCQANAAGKPVIASRINGIPEYVVEGVNGLLFEPGDRAALARSIDHLASLPSEQYATLCRTTREHAEAEFDYAAHYERLMRLIETLVSGRPTCASSSRPTETSTSS